MKHALFLMTLLVSETLMFAQSKEDSLFLQQFSNSATLTVGKSYVLETEVQEISGEFVRSQFLKEGDMPVFNSFFELTNGLAYDTFGDKPLKLTGVERLQFNVNDSTNIPYVELMFTCNEQKYRAFFFEERLPLRVRLRLIEVDFINAINKHLAGKIVYTRTANWSIYHEDMINSSRKFTWTDDGVSCRYCPVTVTRIVNDYGDKYIVLFKKADDTREYCFSGIEFDNKRISGYSAFTSWLTLTDPHKNYPDVPRKRWNQIMAQQITKGFTFNEVKIAFGEPDEVYTEDNKTVFYYSYNRKLYAITFTNGIVTKVQSKK